MRKDEFAIGERLTYFAPKKLIDDNLHFPCVVEEIRPRGRVRVRIFMAGKNENGITRSVSEHRLGRQGELV